MKKRPFETGARCFLGVRVSPGHKNGLTSPEAKYKTGGKMMRDSNFGTSQRYFSRLRFVSASIRKLRASYEAEPSFDKDPVITLFHSV